MIISLHDVFVNSTTSVPSPRPTMMPGEFGADMFHTTICYEEQNNANSEYGWCLVQFNGQLVAVAISNKERIHKVQFWLDDTRT